MTSTSDLYEMLLRHTNKRNAKEYTEVLRGYDVTATADVLRMSSSSLAELKLSPHLRQVIAKARGDRSGIFVGTPADGWASEKLLMAAVPGVVVLSYFMQMTSLFDIIERMTALVVLCLVLVLLLTRAMYILLQEEVLGNIKVTREFADSEGFTASVTIVGSESGVPTSVEGTGESIGVLCHEILLSPFLNYIGFTSRLSWSCVLAVDDRAQTHKTILATGAVSHEAWVALEKLPWIPGIRSIERKMIIKSAPDGASFIVKKNITGLVWFEQEK